MKANRYDILLKNLKMLLIIPNGSFFFNLQERLESMEQTSSVLGNPPSPSGLTTELTEAKKAVINRRRTTSNTRHRYATLTNTAISSTLLQ